MYFDLLLGMQQQVLQQNVVIPRKQEQKDQWSGVFFNAVGIDFLVPKYQVTEVMQVPSVRKMFGVKPWVIGIANIRGTLLPIFDLQGYVSGKNISLNLRSARVLMIETHGAFSGVLVTSVYGIKAFDVENFFNDRRPDKVPEKLAPYVIESFAESEQKLYGVFDLQALLLSEDFMKVSL
jgi:twitching motility protein PilI